MVAGAVQDGFNTGTLKIFFVISQVEMHKKRSTLTAAFFSFSSSGVAGDQELFDAVARKDSGVPGLAPIAAAAAAEAAAAVAEG